MKFNFFNSKYNIYIFSGYLTLSLIRFLVPGQFILTSFLCLLGLIAFSFSFLYKEKITPENVILIFLVLSFLISACVTKRYERILQALFFSVMSSGIAYLLRKSLISSSHILIVFLSLSLFFFEKILAQVDPVTTLEVVSGNSISLMTSVTIISYYIACYNEKKTLMLFPAFINFLICLWAGGRSGIFSSLIILLGLYFLINYKKFLLNLILSLTIFVFIYNIESAYSFLGNFYFFKTSYLRFTTHSFIQEPRIFILKDYLNNLNITNILFGINLKNSWPGGLIYNFDLHNSFLNLTSMAGLIGWCNILMSIFALLIFLRKNLLFFILFLSLIVLCTTDGFIFFESWDFLFLFFIVNAILISDAKWLKLFFLNFRSVK